METFIEEIQMPEPTATTLDRLKFLVNASRRSQAQFSRMIGLDPSSISRLLSGRAPITEQFVNRLVVNLGISKSWFLKGEGVPFPRQTDLPGVSTPQAAEAVERRPKGAPVYDIDATAGIAGRSRIFAEDRIIGYLDFPRIDPKTPVIHVAGDSMEPTLPNNSWIAIREIHDTSIIMWGHIYVVVLEDYRVTKILRRHPSDPDMVVLHSLNEAYDDFEVPRSAIHKLFLVENVISCTSLV